MDDLEAVRYLLGPRAIRERCSEVFDLVRTGQSERLTFDESKLDSAAQLVADETRRNYPNLRVPYHSRWRHFEVDGGTRLRLLDQRMAGFSDAERARSRIDLALVSVLLDAGSGPGWRYEDRLTGRNFARSEGLAIASMDMFLAGRFSSDPTYPLRADAEGLLALNESVVAEFFQVSNGNPLLGLKGRAELLRNLGQALATHPTHFGAVSPRPGNLFDYWRGDQKNNSTMEAAFILISLLESLGEIWPGRLSIGTVNLGDVWRHSKIGGAGATAGLVPFHKLTQWLTYSLLEPLEQAGIVVGGLDHLTGLPEYRNGGLLLDTRVLSLKKSKIVDEALHPADELIIEWRAATVIILDQLGELVRAKLGVTAVDFPLAKVLQGGTWSAGRRIAAEKRVGGAPPLNIISDGTVF